MTQPTLAGVRFSLVGPGRVGSSLARWIVARGGRLCAVGGRSPAGRERLAAELGGTPVPLSELASRDEALVLVAVADDALDEVATALARAPQAAVALHTCGSRGASALAPLAATGVAGGSLHPLFAFPTVRATPPRRLVLGIDGPPPALALARRLAASWGARAVEVPEDSRALYHLAAVLSAGGVATLLALAGELTRRGELPAALAPGFAALAAGALSAASRAADPADAITGPWARGDVATVMRHLEAVTRLAPERSPLVLELAREGVRQCRRRDPLETAVARLGERLAERRLP